MAISPLGNIVYINQNTQLASFKANTQLNRFDLQNFMTAQMLKDKEKIVTNVRPAEEGHKIDANKEQEQPQNESKKKDKEGREALNKQKNGSNSTNLHILDVKV